MEKETVEKTKMVAAIELSDAPEPKDLAIIPEEMSLDDVEKQMISRALTKADGDYEKASAYLGISVRTLRRKLFRLNNQ